MIGKILTSDKTRTMSILSLAAYFSLLSVIFAYIGVLLRRVRKILAERFARLKHIVYEKLGGSDLAS